MSDFILRCAREEDAEQLIRIWQASFGDGEDFIREMLFGCGLLESAVGAEKEGELRSCMFTFDGIEAAGLRCSYLYALCTQPEYRGMGLGRAVTSYAGEMALFRGADAAFLRPADPKLEKWYADTLGALPFAGGDFDEFTTLPPSPSDLSPAPISAEEYSALRQNGVWKIPSALLKAQETVNRFYGGAFLRYEGGALCAEICEGGVFIREALGDENSAVAAAVDFFAAEKIHMLRKSPESRRLMLLGNENERIISAALPPLPFVLD